MAALLWLLERPWVVWLILLPVAIAYTLPFQWAGDDVFEMAAAIRAASENLLDPRNPMLNLPGETSPRFTPYVIFWGAVMKASGASVYLIIQMTVLVNFALFATSLTRFVVAQFGDRKLATVLIPVMLLCWGAGYSMANVYFLWLFFYSLPYAATFAFGAGFFALSELAAFLKSGRKRSLACYAVLGALVFLCHPITGVFVFVTAGVMALFAVGFRRAVWLQGAAAGAFVLALLWPYFDYRAVFVSGAIEPWYEPEMFTNQFRALGVAWAGYLLAIWYALGRQQMFLVTLLFVFLLAYLVSWASQIFIGERFLIFSVFGAHLFIAVFIVEFWNKLASANRFQWKRHGLQLLLVLLILGVGTRWRGWDIKTSGTLLLSAAGMIPQKETKLDRYRFLEDYLTSSDIILAEGETGWPLPAICGSRLVYHQHGNPLLTSELETRLRDTNEFLAGAFVPSERERIQLSYGVTHVLLNLKEPHTFSPVLPELLEQNGTCVVEQNSLALFRLDSTSSPKP